MSLCRRNSSYWRCTLDRGSCTRCTQKSFRSSKIHLNNLPHMCSSVSIIPIHILHKNWLHLYISNNYLNIHHTVLSECHLFLLKLGNRIGDMMYGIVFPLVFQSNNSNTMLLSYTFRREIGTLGIFHTQMNYLSSTFVGSPCSLCRFGC